MFKKVILLIFILFCLVYSPVFSENLFPSLELPKFTITGIENIFQIKNYQDNSAFYRISDSKNMKCNVEDIKGKKYIRIRFKNTSDTIKISYKNKSEIVKLRILPGFLSLLPPLIAITLAFITKDVIISLVFGIFLGSFLVYNFNPFIALLRLIDKYVLYALFDKDHLSIILFSLIIGGMIGVVSNSGGAKGIVNKLSKFVRGCRSGQFSTWLMGVVIFFDDYANTLLVGNTMRPLSDRLRISREKLAYIVDSTAAPVASLFVISTWIGYELGQISDAVKSINVQSIVAAKYQQMSTIGIFLQTVPYRFYAIFTLFFVLAISLLLRDYGPMYYAEKRARRKGELLSNDAKPLSNVDELMNSRKENWITAFIPILSLILIVMSGLWITGRNAILASGGVAALKKATLYNILGQSESMNVLIWGSFISTIIAISCAVLFKSLTLKESVEAWIAGMKSMMLAIIILVLSWGLSSVCKSELLTSQYVGELAKSHISFVYFPLLIFSLSGFIAFSTGTSWGTMGILFPIAIPVSFQLVIGLSPEYADRIVLGTIAAVLSGASFGDHCSPISDTTIMSSMASGCDHIDHVRTQLPYALTSGTIAGLSGFLLIGFGMNPFLSILIGLTLSVLIILTFGKKTDENTIMNEILDDMKSSDLELKKSAAGDLISFKEKVMSPKLLQHIVNYSSTEDDDRIKQSLIKMGKSVYKPLINSLSKTDNIENILNLLNEMLSKSEPSEEIKKVLGLKLKEILSSDLLNEELIIKIMIISSKINATEVLNPVIDLMESDNNKIKATAVMTIGLLGGKEVFSKISEIIKNSSGRVLANAIESISYIKDIDSGKVKEIVSGFINDSNYRIRALSKKILFNVTDDPEIIESLHKDYECASNINDKLSIIFILGQMANLTSIRILLKLIEIESEPVCIQKIIEILRQKGQTSILPFLNEILNNNAKGS